MPLRWIVLGVATILALAIAVRVLYAPASEEVYVVTEAPLQQTVVATGRVEGPARIEIGSTVLGTVARVLVDEGDRVEAGQALIELRADQQQAALARAQAAEAQARARLRQLEQVDLPAARETLIQARLRAAQAERDWERTRQLAEEGFQSRAELEARREALDIARSALRNAQLQLAGLEADGAVRQRLQTELAQAEAALREARAQLDDTRLLAPTAGTIIRRAVEPGDVVSAGKALLVLSQAGPTKLVVQLDERHLARVALDQPALASADAFPEQRFAARVSRIGSAVDAARGTVEVELAVPEPPPYLRDDMTVSVDIVTARRERALLVPPAALRRDGDRPWLLVERGGERVRQPVTLGLQGESGIEILQGVQAGERVILPPPGERAQGMPSQMWGGG